MVKNLIAYRLSLLLCTLFFVLWGSVVFFLLWWKNIAPMGEKSGERPLKAAEELYSTIKQNYYGFSGWTQERINEGILKGMTDALWDKHSVYFNPQETKDFNNSIAQNFEGIGAYVGQSASGVVIHKVFSGSPAEVVGITKGDIIVQAWDIKLAWLPVDKAVSFIRGPQGTKVNLVIIPIKNPLETKKITVTRGSVDIPSVDSRIEAGTSIGYIQVGLFGEKTPAEFKRALDKLTGSGAKSLIIDMRDNPGGLLSGAVELLENFTPKGSLLVETRGTHPELNEKIFSTREPVFKGNIVVLTNKGSASAAEIFAWALSDLGLASLIGEKTYGKWSVQEVFQLGAQWEVKITIAAWYTPLGKGIDGKGISPNIEVIMTKEDFEKNQDPVIKRAVEFLKK